MKNLIKNFAVLACGALVAVSMTSCHHDGDDEEGSGTVIKTAVVTAKTLQVNLSSALPSGATLTYNGANASSASGTKYIFENVADGGSLKLTGSTIVPQNATISFGSRSTIAIDLSVVTKQTGTAITASGANSNSAASGATSAATLPAAAVTADPTLASKTFNVQLYAPAQSPVSEVKSGETKSASPLALNCEPDGTSFGSNPVDVAITMTGAGGADVEVVPAAGGTKATGTWSGDTYKANLTHFSVWNVIMKFKVQSVTEKVIDLGTKTFVAGENTLAYNENAGFESSVKGVTATALQALFGATKAVVAKNYKMNASAAGNIKFTQNVKEVSLQSGNLSVTATVYGAVEAEVSYTNAGGGVIPAPQPVVPTPTPTPAHNGGSSD